MTSAFLSSKLPPMTSGLKKMSREFKGTKENSRKPNITPRNSGNLYRTPNISRQLMVIRWDAEVLYELLINFGNFKQFYKLWK